MTPVERRILIKVSTMYYLEHMKQTEIAKRLGVERTTISKHLKRALDQGIVTITVANENFEDIESAMEKRFGLKECFIVPRSYDLLAVKQAMGRAGLQLLRRIVDNKQVIGLAWGTSIRELTRHAQNSKVPQIDADFVPLDGGPENIDSELHVNTLCYELARAFGGRCHYIYAPVITRTAEIRNAIVQDANYEKISDFWKKLDIALVGIGAPVKSSNLVWMGEFGRQAIESLSRTGTVGEICSVFYDKNGREVKTDFSDRIIGVDLDTLRNLNYSIGMAASREKVPAIMGACKGQAINVLITDEQTAKIMLNE
ncbi:MAG: sugar-binding transcriptional regulator [Selenomonadaceae bacterium]|nr:sugar-binding transcriptional regulator [Selenomonadaceae bacterium]